MMCNAEIHDLMAHIRRQDCHKPGRQRDLAVDYLATTINLLRSELSTEELADAPICIGRELLLAWGGELVGYRPYLEAACAFTDALIERLGARPPASIEDMQLDTRRTLHSVVDMAEERGPWKGYP
jgi:hypothetical protein